MTKSPALLGIDHVQMAMPPGGEGEARRFWRDTLGLSETPKPPDLAARGGCWFEGPGLRLHLGVEADFRPARKAHPALLVRGLAELRRALADGGYAIRDDEPLDGYDRIFVADPFGNRVELMEPRGPA
jgi:catechol 2,3-dioxygenase-like lactoylglutathione lyase family enzyme